MHLEGDFELSLSTKKLDQPALHEMLQEQNEQDRHRTLEWIQDESGQHVRRRMQDIIFGGHLHGRECDEGRNLKILCPCNGGESESSDEDRNNSKIQLPHMSLNTAILPRITTLQQ